MRSIRLAFVALALSLCALAQTPFHLQNGDRVVFYGDSITDQRLYTTFTETFVITRFPKLDVTFVHSGWGGDRVTGGAGGEIDLRLQRDVIAYRPTVMTIMLGMNDGKYRDFDQEIFDTYARGYEAIVRSMKSALPGIRITAIRPSPYDDVTREPMFAGGYNAVLVRYGDFLQQLAVKEKLNIADLNAAVVAALQKANSADPEGARRLIPDRVHPGAAGHLLMAAELLKAWKAPALVSSVVIDAARPEAVQLERSAVTDLRALENGGLAWTELDQALPMPLDLKDKSTALAVQSSDLVEKLNQQTLKIAGLSEGKFTLKVDGEPAGSFTAAELAAGINLAVLPTPMAAQAAEVHALTLKRAAVHNTRWRQLDVPLAKEGLQHAPAAIAALDRLDEELAARQRYMAQPKARKFEVVKE